MEKVYLTWQDVEQLIRTVMGRLRQDKFDALIAITRGGIIPGGILAEKLDIQQVLIASVEFYQEGEAGIPLPVFVQFPEDAFLTGKYILVVDDIWDAGLTLTSVRERIEQAGGRCLTVVLHYRPQSSRVPNASPDVYGGETTDWIAYPWEQERGRRLA